MEILAEKKDKKWLLMIDGESMTLKAAEKVLKASRKVIYWHLNRGGAEALIKWKDNKDLTKKLGVSSLTKVYQRNGETFWIDKVIEITGNTRSTCYRKLLEWQDGDITTSELLAKKRTKKQLAKLRTTLANATKKKKVKVEPVLPIMQGMQPRKNIKELPRAGSWEREADIADNGNLIERTNTGTNSSGGYYTR